MAAFARERDPFLAVRHQRRDPEPGAGAEHRARARTRDAGRPERARLVRAQHRERMGERLEIVDRMDDGKAELLGELVAVEAPVDAVGELDLAAGDRTRDRKHGGTRRKAVLVEIAADRRLGARHQIVVDHADVFRPPTRGADRKAGGTSADIGEQNAGHG